MPAYDFSRGFKTFADAHAARAATIPFYAQFHEFARRYSGTEAHRSYSRPAFVKEGLAFVIEEVLAPYIDAVFEAFPETPFADGYGADAPGDVARGRAMLGP